MNKFIALLVFIVTSSFAQDFTYSTNLFYALTYTTNIYIGTNGTDTNGDNYHIWVTKINHNTTWLSSQNNARIAEIAVLKTNCVFTNVVSMPFGFLNQYTVTNSTNSTFGYKAGLLALDTNYLYFSIGSNTWRRIAIPTNTW